MQDPSESIREEGRVSFHQKGVSDAPSLRAIAFFNVVALLLADIEYRTIKCCLGRPITGIHRQSGEVSNFLQ